jgi:hypothetical protein
MTAQPTDLEPTPDPWIERQLAKSHPLTEGQQVQLRRVLLPPVPLPKPA